MPTPTTPTTRATQAHGQHARTVQDGAPQRRRQPQPTVRPQPPTPISVRAATQAITHAPTHSPTPLRAHAPALCTGAQLRELRLARGLTRREIAGRLGYAATTIKAWELGRRAVPAHLAPLLYEVLDQVTAHLASERERFLGVLRAAWVG